MVDIRKIEIAGKDRVHRFARCGTTAGTIDRRLISIAQASACLCNIATARRVGVSNEIRGASSRYVAAHPGIKYDLEKIMMHTAPRNGIAGRATERR